MMEQILAVDLGWFLGLLVKGLGVELGLKCGLLLQATLALVGYLKELFVDKLRRELLE